MTLGALPDEVLLHILAQLPLIEILRAAELSSKWKALASALNNLTISHVFSMIRSLCCSVRVLLHPELCGVMYVFSLYQEMIIFGSCCISPTGDHLPRIYQKLSPTAFPSWTSLRFFCCICLFFFFFVLGLFFPIWQQQKSANYITLVGKVFSRVEYEKEPLPRLPQKAKVLFCIPRCTSAVPY